MHLNKFYQNALILLALDTLDDGSGYMEMVIREKVVTVSGTGYTDSVSVRKGTMPALGEESP